MKEIVDYAIELCITGNAKFFNLLVFCVLMVIWGYQICGIGTSALKASPLEKNLLSVRFRRF